MKQGCGGFLPGGQQENCSQASQGEVSTTREWEMKAVRLSRS